MMGGINFSRSVVTNSPVRSPGKAIDLAAPGFGILSVYPGYQMCIASGTSMAAPHVSGLVALYIAANGRATNAEGVHRIRQALIDNGLPQSQWRSAPNTGDPDGNPEPLAIASEAWVPPVTVSNPVFTPQGFQLSFNAVPGYLHSVQYSSLPGPFEPVDDFRDGRWRGQSRHRDGDGHECAVRSAVLPRGAASGTLKS